MSLEASRAKVREMILLAKDLPDEARVVEAAQQWFERFKAWEKEETFERAYKDGRMTARMAPSSQQNELKKFNVVAANGPARQIVLNPNIEGLEARANPQNFLEKKKNDLGLHDLSAVLLVPGRPISQQLFAKPNSLPVFMPIPQEGDLQLFQELSQAAKRNRAGRLYKFVVDARSRMTRIKFGSSDDMAVGFLRIVKDDGKDHFRYGEGTILGQVVDPGILTQRTVNALHYRSKISAIRSKTSNNEVSLTIRQHAGGFPYVGNPGPSQLPTMPTIEAGQWLLAAFQGGRPVAKGVLEDSGAFRAIGGAPRPTGSRTGVVRRKVVGKNRRK